MLSRSTEENASRSPVGSTLAAAFVAFLVIIALVIGLAAACTGFDRPDAGTIGVVRNGGPIDNRNIREVLEPGAGTSWIGLFSNSHFYPADTVQRYYTITADPTAQGDRPGIDVVRVPTSDGVRLGVEGTFYFRTGFNGSEAGTELVKDFDNQFGVRTFPQPGGGHELHPYEGDPGWGAFLNSILRPIIDNEIRVAMASYRCEELITSCALVVHQGGTTSVEEGGDENTANLSRIQETVEQGVAEQLTQSLGKAYLGDVTFKLVRVEPDEEIQAAINSALAAFAQVSTARAQVEQAEQQRIAAEKLAAVYERSPALAQIQMIREAAKLPSGANIYIGVNPTVTTGH